MAQYRFLVAMHKGTEPVADHITNTFYLDTDALGGTDDVQALADDAAALWGSYRSYPSVVDTVTVRAYNMSDTPPREVVAESTVGITTHAGVGMPREVACCLSYYADRNLPRLRGRMYIGPFSTAQASPRPTGDVFTDLVDLAEGISGLGGIDVQWVQFSPTTGAFSTVTDYWIDDEWDTVRSRGLEATTRTLGTVSG